MFNKRKYRKELEKLVNIDPNKINIDRDSYVKDLESLHNWLSKLKIIDKLTFIVNIGDDRIGIKPDLVANNTILIPSNIINVEIVNNMANNENTKFIFQNTDSLHISSIVYGNILRLNTKELINMDSKLCKRLELVTLKLLGNTNTKYRTNTKELISMSDWLRFIIDIKDLIKLIETHAKLIDYEINTKELQELNNHAMELQSRKLELTHPTNSDLKLKYIQSYTDAIDYILEKLPKQLERFINS